MRRVIHVDRDGKYAALDNRDAIIVDSDTNMLRVGLDRWPINRPTVFAFLSFMLRRPNWAQSRVTIGTALGTPKITPSTLSSIARHSEPYLVELGMVLETVYGTGGYILHTEPRKSLPCCRNIAPGLPLPSRLKNTLAEPGKPLTTCASSRARSTTSLAR